MIHRMSLFFVFCVFFFQAEDGIRDWSVTGVQTCALPIYALSKDGTRLLHGGKLGVSGCNFFCGHEEVWFRLCLTHGGELISWMRSLQSEIERSEERRVGKECRGWGVAEH